jgi:hypothetical protein
MNGYQDTCKTCGARYRFGGECPVCAKGVPVYPAPREPAPPPAPVSIRAKPDRKAYLRAYMKQRRAADREAQGLPPARPRDGSFDPVAYHRDYMRGWRSRRRVAL